MFRYLLLASIAIFVIGCGGGGGSGNNNNSSLPPVFTPVSSTMTTARAGHAQVTLQNGSVLISGGFSSSIFPGSALYTAELFNPVTSTFTAISNHMQSPRTNHTATLLLNGQVLLSGGQIDNNNGDGSSTAELFDPVTQTFMAISAHMTSPRGGHAAVLLNDGTVLVIGGFNNSSTPQRTAEVFDPATNTFTALTALMTLPRAEFTAILLPDGKVLIAGGESNKIGTDTAEIFDPATSTFTAIGATMRSIRFAHSGSQLSNGHVLLTGGASSFFTSPVSGVDTAELFDPTTQNFTSVSSKMTSPRFEHASSLLADGSVLITGGATSFNGSTVDVLNTGERFVP